MPETNHTVYHSFEDLRDEESKALLGQIRSSPAPLIIYVQGEPGVGKSVFMENLREKIRFENQIPPEDEQIHMLHFDFENDTNGDAENEFRFFNFLYQKLRDQKQCGWKGLDFPRYELARTFLFMHSRREKTEYRVDGDPLYTNVAKELMKSLGVFSSGLLGAAGGAAAAALVGGAAAAVSVGGAAAVAGLEVFWDYFSERSEPHVRDALQKAVQKIAPDGSLTMDVFTKEFVKDFVGRNDVECRSKLNEYLLQDLCQFAPRCAGKKVIFLDSLEKLSQQQEYWLFRKLLATDAEITWVLTGTGADPFFDYPNLSQRTHPCPWSGPRESDQHSFVWPLNRFSDEKSCALLRLRGVQDETTRNWILQTANGLPAALSILADAYPFDAEFLSDPAFRDFGAGGTDNLYERILHLVYDKHTTEADQKVLRFLAELKELDRELFKYYARETGLWDPEGVYDALIQKSIFRRNDTGTWSLRDVPKRVFHELNKRNDQLRFCRIAYEFYKEDCAKRTDDFFGKSGWDSAAYEKLTASCRNAIYYGVLQCGDRDSFEAFRDWLLRPQKPDRSFQKKLMDCKLYSLKKELLEFFLDRGMQHGIFQYDEGRLCELQANYDLAWADLNLNQYDAAETRVIDLLSTRQTAFGTIGSRENTMCLYTMGVINIRLSRYNIAFIWLKSAVHEFKQQHKDLLYDSELTNWWSKALNSYADVLMNLERYKEAKQRFLQAMELRGVYLNGAGKPQVSGTNYNEAIKMVGNLSKLYFLWGTAARDRARFEKAERYMEACIDFAGKKKCNGGPRHEEEAKIRLKTLRFQQKRLFDPDSLVKGGAREYTEAYETYLGNLQAQSGAAADAGKDMSYGGLNTQHNLSIAHAYAGNIQLALDINARIMEARYTHLPYAGKITDKNLLMEQENEACLKKDPPDLAGLKLIY